MLAKPEAPAEEQRKPAWKRWVPVAVLVLVATVVVHQGWLDYLSLSSIAENRDRLIGYVSQNAARAYALYLAVYVGVIALSLPGGAVLTLVGGFLFGWLVGGLLTVVAATIGGTIVFLIARTSLGPALQGLAQ